MYRVEEQEGEGVEEQEGEGYSLECGVEGGGEEWRHMRRCEQGQHSNHYTTEHCLPHSVSVSL